MTELADVFQQYGLQYRAQFGDKILPSHYQAMRAIERCRTPAQGGHVYVCDHCGETHYHYHSCRNRHCPKCQNDKAFLWLESQKATWLPVRTFMLTFTLPAELRSAARGNQRLIYGLLFRASAEAVQQLAQDKRFIGGQMGMVGVLHTWGRNLVPGGGLADDGTWNPSRANFLLPVKAISRLVRAKFRDALRKADPGCFASVPADAWHRDWVVHCQPVGDGQHALKYLAPYVFRVAIGNKRILKLADGKVTFRYRPTDTGKPKTCSLPALEFIRRFLQHVLPRGFVKVRYYGFLSHSNQHKLPAIRQQLQPVEKANRDDASGDEQTADPSSVYVVRCPACGQVMRRGPLIRPNQRSPPRSTGSR